MEKVFEKIFTEIHEQIEKQLKAGVYNGDQELGIGGTVKFAVPVDGQGNASAEKKVQGFGQTIKAQAVVYEPKDGIFDVEVSSSGGGAISKKGIRAGESVSGELFMEKFLNKTTIRVKGHSSVPNTTIKGEITYHI